jgi:hypothetical protein
MLPRAHRATLCAAFAAVLPLVACEEPTQAPSRTQDQPEQPATEYDLSKLPRTTLAPRPGSAAPQWLRATPETRTTTLRATTKSSKPSPLANGSFELNGGVGTNVFTGWTVVDLAGSFGSWFVQTGGFSPFGFTVGEPTDGSFAAMTDQTGPGTHILYQDVVVPKGVSRTYLSFDLLINNLSGGFATPNTLSHDEFIQNQQFRADIMDPNAPIDDVGAGVLLPVYRTETSDPILSPYRTITVSLRQFRGQVVRLRFAEVDNLGFFQVGIDHMVLGKRPKQHGTQEPATAGLIPSSQSQGRSR